MKARQLTFIGLLVAVLIAGGYVLYLVSRLVPVPGSKFLIMAPYLALIMFIARTRLRSPWTMTFVSLVFGVVITVFTPVMGPTIVVAGLLSDTSGRLLPVTISPVIRDCLIAALYPMWSFGLSMVISNYLTGNLIFGSLGPSPLIVGCGLAYGLGLIGAWFGARTVSSIRELGETIQG